MLLVATMEIQQRLLQTTDDDGGDNGIVAFVVVLLLLLLLLCCCFAVYFWRRARSSRQRRFSDMNNHDGDGLGTPLHRGQSSFTPPDNDGLAMTPMSRRRSKVRQKGRRGALGYLAVR